VKPLRRRTRLFTGTLVLVMLAVPQGAFAWHVRQVPLVTRWSRLVNATHAWPHYPRPQMRRRVWQNLNGLWRYAISPRSGQLPPRHYAGSILVPFPIQSALSGVRETVLPSQCIWYKRYFQIPPAWRGRQILLHIEAANWETRIFINSRSAGIHQGGYTPITANITGFLRPGGQQKIVICVWDPCGERFEPRGKQVLHPHGMYFGQSSGIWGTVWLEPVPDAYIAHLDIVPHVHRQSVALNVQTDGADAHDVIVASVLAGKKLVASASGRPGRFFSVSVPHAHLWSPRSAFLYTLLVRLVRAGKTMDRVSSYFGMRTISVGPGINGRTQILLNGKPVFQRGFLYQGYWPDGLYTPPDDRAMIFDISTAKQMGYNMFRLHQIVEPRRFYYLADRLGLLIWQDMPAAWPPNRRGLSQQEIAAKILASQNWGAIGPFGKREKLDYRHELAAMIRELRDNPSVVVWVPFNESWGIHNVARMVRRIHHLDPSRLIDADSGVNINPIFKNPYQVPGNIVDIHHYPGPRALAPSKTRASAAGECGGVYYFLPHHLWVTGPLKACPTPAMALARYRKDWQEAWHLRNHLGLSAMVFTEFMDQQQEIGGLVTFDRVVKFPVQTIRRITLRP
jgi:beta-galactosidase/beta-glucuronidase